LGGYKYAAPLALESRATRVGNLDAFGRALTGREGFSARRARSVIAQPKSKTAVGHRINTEN